MRDADLTALSVEDLSGSEVRMIEGEAALIPTSAFALAPSIFPTAVEASFIESVSGVRLAVRELRWTRELRDPD
jgi:hypothetical protein